MSLVFIGLALGLVEADEVVQTDVLSDDGLRHKAKGLGQLEWWEALAPCGIDVS